MTAWVAGWRDRGTGAVDVGRRNSNDLHSSSSFAQLETSALMLARLSITGPQSQPPGVPSSAAAASRSVFDSRPGVPYTVAAIPRAVTGWVTAVGHRLGRDMVEVPTSSSVAAASTGVGVSNSGAGSVTGTPPRFSTPVRPGQRTSVLASPVSPTMYVESVLMAELCDLLCPPSPWLVEAWGRDPDTRVCVP